MHAGRHHDRRRGRRRDRLLLRRRLGRITSIQQHGVTGGDAVAEKRIDFAYDADGQYATITRYADLAGTELVATATYTFDDAYRLTGLEYTQGETTLASYGYTFDDATKCSR